ncbi:MAG TPA: sugar phosphate nucleotidyltransferase [Candidatus Hydrogenedens sp.]|nr:sugar phosphate nucleotidyltransferase [Candidatus Hydrogenedens sp.]
MVFDKYVDSNIDYEKCAVIMAGGIGERFWPLSRPECPKQLLPFGIHGNTLIQDALERVSTFIPVENIVLATSEVLKPTFVSLGLLPESQIITEPCRRNTAGCLSFVVAKLLAVYGEMAREIIMAVITADQLIKPVEDFVQTAICIMDYVAKNKVLGIIGIPPSRPETGFGYIEVKEQIELSGKSEVFTVQKFHEKPNEHTAEEYIKAGNYYWNSGMFFWKVQTFLDEIEKASPVHWKAIMEMSEELRKGEEDKVNHIFQTLPNTSIDYALMENTKNVVMVKANFYWDDLGSWTSLERILTKDADGNIVKGKVITLNTNNSIIYNGNSEQITVTTLGIHDLIVAVSRDVILIMDKKESQNLKQLLEKIEEYDGHKGE